MTERVESAIDRFAKKNHMSTTYWRDMYADLLTWCRVNELHASESDALALLRELNDALVIPGWIQPRVDALLDRAE